MPRIEIQFQVRNLSVEKLGYDAIPAGNSNYIYAVFTVDEVWQQVERPMAVFTAAGKSWMVELTKAREGSLEGRVPYEAMAKPGEIEVGLRGGNRLVTDRARVRVVVGADPDAMPSGDTVEDWVSKVDRTIDEKMQQARIDTVDQLAPPFHQIAPVVQEEFVADYPLDVVSHILPVQDGEGTPTTENVRPIHGHTEIKLTKCSANLLDKKKLVPLITGADGSVEKVGSKIPGALYAGETYTRQPSEEVFGGEFNWETGALTVSQVSVTFTGEENWVYNDGKFKLARAVPNAGTTDGKKQGLCNIAVYKNSGYEDDAVFVSSDSTTLVCGNALTAKYGGDLARFKAQLAKTPMQIVYYIQTPTTANLAPQELLALSGKTTLYSSTGDTEVTGRRTPVAVISTLEARVSALEKFHTKM